MTPKVQSPAYKMGTSSRSQDTRDRNKTPGPGAYKHGESIDGGPDKTRAPSVKFGSEERRPVSANLNSTPGAGSCKFPFLHKSQKLKKSLRKIQMTQDQKTTGQCFRWGVGTSIRNTTQCRAQE